MMSREFGDENGGFFHNKISHALDDAKGGTTDGAKLMAAFLKPLADIAYEVSGEEACDSGPERVVEAIDGAIEKVQTALQAMKWYVQPAREMAARAIAATLKKSVKLDGNVIVIPEKLCPENVPDAVWKQAISIMCGGKRVQTTSWSGRHVYYGVSSSPCPYVEIAALKEELAALKLGIERENP